MKLERMKLESSGLFVLSKCLFQLGASLWYTEKKVFGHFTAGDISGKVS